jgi:acyl-CoA reductase-like NAD-dependent aldehyde dehydrogenase
MPRARDAGHRQPGDGGRDRAPRADAGAIDVGRAVAAGQRAFDEGTWSRASIHERARVAGQLLFGMVWANDHHRPELASP